MSEVPRRNQSGECFYTLANRIKRNRQNEKKEGKEPSRKNRYYDTESSD